MKDLKDRILESDVNEDIDELDFLEEELRKVIIQVRYEFSKCRWDFGVKKELITYEGFMEEIKKAKKRVNKILNK